MRLRTAGIRFATAMVLLAAPLFAPCVNAKGEPQDLQILAIVDVPFGAIPHTKIQLAPDGTTRITQAGRTAGEEPLVLTFRLTTEERARTRKAVVAARYFDTRDPARPPPTDSASWHVVIRLGDRQLEREDLGAHPGFEVLERELFRFVRQAQITAELRKGQTSSARSLLLHRFERGCVHPPALVDEIVACADGIDEPRRCGQAATPLVAMPVAEWLRGAGDLLARVEGERRGEVLTAWAGELGRKERAANRDAFLPVALAEVVARWRGWLDMGVRERTGLGWFLAMSLRDATTQAFEVAEQMARTLSKPGKPLVPQGLLATGEKAVPIVLRLLDAPQPGARECGAKMASLLLRVARKKTLVGEEELSDSDRAALEKRFGKEVVPALERHAQDVSESHAVREGCFHALDRWDGRVQAAKARAREEAAAARKRAEAERATAAGPEEPAGTLSISGRLLGPSDLPLPGFTVWAFGRGTWPAGRALTAEDGSFRVEGLAAGTYDLGCTGPGRHLASAVMQTPRVVKGAGAGSTDVVLRLPGTLIHGRLLDEAGAPAAGLVVVAQMRDPPRSQGLTYLSAAATTDAQGRFWLVRLVPGIYDLRIPGRPSVRGASDIETGPEERTVELLAGVSIAGRVVDETGAPLAGSLLSITESGKGPSEVLQRTQAVGGGTFRFTHLRPGRRYTVAASFGGGGEQRNALAKDVAPETTDLLLRIDTSPRLRFRIDYAGRGSAGWGVRLEGTAGGRPATRIFRENPVDWRGAPPGTWRVFAKVRNLDAKGLTTFTWIELGTVTTGEAETTLVVPR